MAYFPCHATSPDFLEKKSLGKKKFLYGNRLSKISTLDGLSEWSNI